MRSNDVFIGLLHDAFCFSMIQEMVARSIAVDVGQYIHVVGSLHLYDNNAEDARRFLDEGYFGTKEMPPMPDLDPMAAIAEILAVEAQLRSGSDPLRVPLPPNPYWGDLARLLVVFFLHRGGRRHEIASVVDQMSTDVYGVHIEDLLDRTRPDR
jgi:thymidylate synthase